MTILIFLVYSLAVLNFVDAYVIPLKPTQTLDVDYAHLHLSSHSIPWKSHSKRQLLGGLAGVGYQIMDGIHGGGGGNLPGYVISLVPDPAQATPSEETVSAAPSVPQTPLYQPTSAARSTSTPSSKSGTSTTSVSTGTPASSAATIVLPAASQLPPSPAISAPADQDGSPKYVIAHHMVGNTHPYSIYDWTDDIMLAHASGIDGFALNCGADEWERVRVADAYEAAKRSGLDFKLFISLDMTSLQCGSPDDASRLCEVVKPYLNHPNQFQYDSRTFVSTFSGETCTFGQANIVEGWKSQFVNHADLQGKIYFVPAFFIDPEKFSDFSEVMDGDFNWNSGWPIQITTSFVKNLLSSPNPANITDPVPDAAARITNVALDLAVGSITSTIPTIERELSQFIGSTETDIEHLKGLEALRGSVQARDGESKKPVYMGAVSPWFFTHYGQDSFNKNWIFLSDQHLYAKRWESIIASRDEFDVIQVLTWNDYGESHYIGPIKGAQPNSESWVNGFNHTGWLTLTKYYATAYKAGAFPAIEKDQILMWSRPHPAEAKVNDPVGQPDNFELCQDVVWAIVMATASSTVVLSTSSSGDDTQQFQVPAGLSKLSIPITPGGIMKGVIQRDGRTIVALTPTPNEFTFQGAPTSYNFNAFVASATAE